MVLFTREALGIFLPSQQTAASGEDTDASQKTAESQK
jgi:hypothetical protein